MGTFYGEAIEKQPVSPIRVTTRRDRSEILRLAGESLHNFIPNLLGEALASLFFNESEIAIVGRKFPVGRKQPYQFRLAVGSGLAENPMKMHPRGVSAYFQFRGDVPSRRDAGGSFAGRSMIG